MPGQQCEMFQVIEFRARMAVWKVPHQEIQMRWKFHGGYQVRATKQFLQHARVTGIAHLRVPAANHAVKQFIRIRHRKAVNHFPFVALAGSHESGWWTLPARFIAS